MSGFERCKVLVVDDNVDAADVLAHVLTMLGVQVQTAYGGREAVATASEWRPNLILMDIRMPDLDGYAAASAIRQVPGLSEVQIVAVSGWTGDPARYAQGAHLFARFLPKPLSIEALKRVLAECG